jgi:hypothetical protein
MRPTPALRLRDPIERAIHPKSACFVYIQKGDAFEFNRRLTCLAMKFCPSYKCLDFPRSSGNLTRIVPGANRLRHVGKKADLEPFSTSCRVDWRLTILAVQHVVV